MNKLTRLTGTIALATSALTATSAFADMSYNLGYASEYHFRGILQKNSSASAGADFESGGFYAGTWAADVGDGLEVDGYFGYGIETESGISAGVGFTGYYYTGDTFDTEYEEINLSAGYGLLTVDYAIGKHDIQGGGDEDYTYLALTLEAESGLYGTYGTWGDEFDGDFIQIGYVTTVAELDLGIALILASKELSFELDDSGNPASDESLVFTIGKSF